MRSCGRKMSKDVQTQEKRGGNEMISTIVGSYNSMAHASSARLCLLSAGSAEQGCIEFSAFQ